MLDFSFLKNLRNYFIPVSDVGLLGVVESWRVDQVKLSIIAHFHCNLCCYWFLILFCIEFDVLLIEFKAIISLNLVNKINFVKNGRFSVSDIAKHQDQFLDILILCLHVPNRDRQMASIPQWHKEIIEYLKFFFD